MTRRDAALLAGGAALSGALAAPQTNPLCFQTAVELARLIRERKVSAHEVMTAHLKQIERVNPKVNAIVTLLAEDALKQAVRADQAVARGEAHGPLHGLPVGIKDLHETAGVRTTYGSRIFKDFVPKQDALIVERLKHAGAIVIGKTNTPEFGAGSQTFNEVFGSTKNPYDLSKTCGGSSGGSAVGVACGLFPIADGSDMGGSLRNPASFCNVVGMRTAPGRVPGQSAVLGWSTLSVSGMMARTTADLALALSAVAGPDNRSPIALTDPGSSFARPLARDFKGTRIAWWRDLGGVSCDSRVRTVVDAQRKTFESLGCVLEQSEPDFTGADEAFRILRSWSFHAQYGPLLEKNRPLMKDTVIEEIERGARLTGPQISRAEALRTALYQRMRIFFEKHDFFVLPVSQVPPFDVTKPYVTEIEGVEMQTYIDWMKTCFYISITGHPAISIPAGFTPEGLPIGLQIVGKHRGEWELLQLAHAFEQVNRSGRTAPTV
jgi:amidase